VPQRVQAGGGAIRAPQDSQNGVSGGTSLWHRGHVTLFFPGPGSFILPRTLPAPGNGEYCTVCPQTVKNSFPVYRVQIRPGTRGEVREIPQSIILSVRITVLHWKDGPE
jgi:hypothetical protein